MPININAKITSETFKSFPILSETKKEYKVRIDDGNNSPTGRQHF